MTTLEEEKNILLYPFITALLSILKILKRLKKIFPIVVGLANCLEHDFFYPTFAKEKGNSA